MKLYGGLPAGLQRQISSASLRIGLYDTFQEFFTTGRESKPEGSWEGRTAATCPGPGSAQKM